MYDETNYLSDDENTAGESVANAVGVKLAKIENLDSKISEALNRSQWAVSAANNATSKPSGVFFKNKKRIQALQSAGINIAGAVAANSQAIKELYTYLIELSMVVTELFDLSATNLATVREAITVLKNRLNGTSGETLSDFSKQQLKEVIQKLRDREDMFARQANIEKANRDTREELKRLKKELEELKKGDKRNWLPVAICVLCAVIVLACIPPVYFMASSGVADKNASTSNDPVNTQELPNVEINLGVIENGDAQLDTTVRAPSKGTAFEEPQIGAILDKKTEDEPEIDDVPAGSETPSGETKPDSSGELDAIGEMSGTAEPDTTTEADPSLAPVATYAIDTIAYNQNEFNSLVVDEDGVVYYINEGVAYNSENSDTIDLKNDFETPIKNCCLAYDPYHDIIYLLAGGRLSVFDITDFNNPTLILDTNSCPNLPKDSFMYSPQIVVLEDGSLLVPIMDDGTYRITPLTNTVVKFARIYNFANSGYYASVVGSNIIIFSENDEQAIIKSLGGGEERKVTLEIAAPHNRGAVHAVADGVMFYADRVGLCKYDTEGNVTVVIAQESIHSYDYQSLDNTNIWCFAANAQGYAAFYDNTLKCIRYIYPEQ